MLTIDREKVQKSELKEAIEIGMDISKIVDKDQLEGAPDDGQVQQKKKLPKLASEVQQANASNDGELPSLLHQVRHGGPSKIGSGGEVTMGLNA